MTESMFFCQINYEESARFLNRGNGERRTFQMEEKIQAMMQQQENSLYYWGQPNGFVWSEEVNIEQDGFVWSEEVYRK